MTITLGRALERPADVILEIVWLMAEPRLGLALPLNVFEDT